MMEDQPFEPHPNLSDDINDSIIRSEIEGGAYLNRLGVGDSLRVITVARPYLIEHRKDGFYISGHPEYCPEPTRAVIHGSTWGGSMLKVNFIGINMYLELRLETLGKVLTTSLILHVEEVL